MTMPTAPRVMQHDAPAQLLRAALRGTSQQPDCDAAQVLLASGLRGMARSGGYIAPKMTKPLAIADTAPAQRCNRRVVMLADYLLRDIASSSRYQGLTLTQFENVKRLLKQKQQGLPPEAEALHLQKHMAKHTFSQVYRISSRGQWLFNQFSRLNWQDIMPFRGGTASNRRPYVETAIATLRTMREQDPAQARTMLQDYLQDLNLSGFLRNLIATLHINLSRDDEAFLLALEEHPRPDVRRCALEVLMHIPQSDFSQRVLAITDQCLRLFNRHDHDTIRLDFVWADTTDVPQSSAVINIFLEKYGFSGWQPEQIVSLVPPHILCQRFGISPEQLVWATFYSPIRTYFMDSWTHHVIATQDAGFALALIDGAPEIGKQQLLQLTTEAQRQQRAYYWLCERPEWTDGHRAQPYLTSSTETWSRDLSAQFFIALRKLLENPNASSRALEKVLTFMAHLHPSTIEPMLIVLTDVAAHHAQSNTLTTCMDMLHFRKRLHAAFFAPEARP